MIPTVGCMIAIGIGTKVSFILNPSLFAIVTAICIRDKDYVTYELSYNLNGEPKSAWAIEKEFKVEYDGPYMITVGFKGSNV